MKRKLTLLVLTGGYFMALGWNCLPNIGGSINLAG